MENRVLICFMGYEDYFFVTIEESRKLRLLALELNLPLYFFGIKEDSVNILFNFKNV